MLVYLISSGDLYKIGYTKNIKKRLKELGTGNPDLLLLETYQSEWARTIETTLHRRYSYCRVAGELFNLDKKDIENFNKICSNIENGLNVINIDFI